MSFWDGEASDWIFMVEVEPGRLQRLQNGAPVRATYFAAEPSDSKIDLYLPLSTLVLQHLSWTDIVDRLGPLENDLHLLCEILEKLELLSLRAAEDSYAAFLAASELEFLVRVVRSTYDQFQKLIKVIAKRIYRLDGSGPLLQGLPDSFARIVLQNEKPRDVDEIRSRFSMPEVFARFYSEEAPFFISLREIRNGLEHRGDSAPIVFSLPQGLAVQVNDPIWLPLPMWQGVPITENGLGPLRAVFAYIVSHVLAILQDFTSICAGSLAMPAPLSEGYQVYLRNPYGHNLTKLADEPPVFWNSPQT